MAINERVDVNEKGSKIGLRHGERRRGNKEKLKGSRSDFILSALSISHLHHPTWIHGCSGGPWHDGAPSMRKRMRAGGMLPLLPLALVLLRALPITEYGVL